MSKIIKARNVGRISPTRLFRKDLKGASFQVPRDVALVVAQELYGEKSVPSSIPTAKLQEILDKAFKRREFSWQVTIKE